MVNSLFTDPAQILKEHQTIIISSAISEFVLANYTSQQFKLPILVDQLQLHYGTIG